MGEASADISPYRGVLGERRGEAQRRDASGAPIRPTPADILRDRLARFGKRVRELGISMRRPAFFSTLASSRILFRDSTSSGSWSRSTPLQKGRRRGTSFPVDNRGPDRCWAAPRVRVGQLDLNGCSRFQVPPEEFHSEG